MCFIYFFLYPYGLLSEIKDLLLYVFNESSRITAELLVSELLVSELLVSELLVSESLVSESLVCVAYLWTRSSFFF